MENIKKELSNFYPIQIVDDAIEYVNRFYKSSMLEALEIITISKECASVFAKEIENQFKRKLAYAYIDGIRYATAKKFNSETLKKEITYCEYINNIDFAFVFNYHDNDFSSLIEMSAIDYKDKLLELIGSVNDSSTNKTIFDFFKKDVDNYLNPDKIIELFKTLVHAYIMINKNDDNCLRQEDFSFENNLNNTDKTIKYLKISKENFIFGTCQEIDEYTKTNFEETYDNETHLWNNGETLIVKIKNGEIITNII